MIHSLAEAPAMDAPESRFVEILTAPITGNAIGYGFGGSLPGPNALVAGDAALIEALSERLLRLPTLPWMWGKLYLVSIDGSDCADLEDVRDCLAEVQLDELILLPHTKTLQGWQQSVDQGYWTTLRLCSRLGMIEGRGVRGDLPL